jgi:hypothetical protein
MGSSNHKPLTLTTEVGIVVSGSDLKGVVNLSLLKPAQARILNLKLIRTEEYGSVGGKSFKETHEVQVQQLTHWPDNYVPAGSQDYPFLMKLPRGTPGDFCVESPNVRAKVTHELVAELNSDARTRASKQIELISENLFETKELRVARDYSKRSLICFSKSTASLSFSALNSCTIGAGILVRLEADLTHSRQSLKNVELRLIRRLELIASRKIEEVVCTYSLSKAQKGQNYAGDKALTLKLDLERLSQQCTSLARGVKLKYRLEVLFEAMNRPKVVSLGEVGVYSGLMTEVRRELGD